MKMSWFESFLLSNEMIVSYEVKLKMSQVSQRLFDFSTFQCLGGGGETAVGALL